IVIIVMCTILGVSAKQTTDTTGQNVLEQKGYSGTLPDILDKFQPTKPAAGTPVFEAEEGFDNPDTLKPVPRDNPAFVDIILKKDKTSKYVNDINKIIPQVQNLINSIENEENVQMFVAKATTFDFSVGALRKKYEGKPESYYISYTKLMALAVHAKSLAELRKEGAEYNKYLAYQAAGAIYAPDNINRELQYLLEELQETLATLREVD
ncbi:MAG: hypothetical protein LUB59_02685, partial [Candidatus Gastranaerophilales bacterium]|nr:hypothetical protein [Candidatus Gastranaerophilales bacterium]